MRYEVVYTMSRPATDAEWAAATRLASAWLAQERALVPRRFDEARIEISESELVVQFADSEDLRVERAGTTPIWSARAKTVASSRLLAGVLLCLQYACSAEVLQLSSEKPGGWQAAARALTPVWEGDYEVRALVPMHIKADRLLYVASGSNASQLRDFFRAALEMEPHALPDEAFTDVPLDA
jgi:hypothetical protein